MSRYHYQSPKRADAKRLLTHYFNLVGGIYDGDNTVEIQEIVDHIVDAAVEEAVRAIKAAASAQEGLA